NYGTQILDISAIPFVSSIMKSLGISDDMISSIISDSEIKGEGVNLNTLISDLKSLQKTSFFTGTSFQNSSDAESIKEMLQQLKLSVEKGEVKNSIVQNTDIIAKNSDITYKNNDLNNRVSLGDFVSTLEGLRQKTASKDKENQASSNSKLSEEISLTGLNQSQKTAFSLLEATGNTQVKNDTSESEKLIKKFMGDLQINNSASTSAKAAKEEQLTETEMRYRALKSANHQLLMGLSETSQDDQSVDAPSMDSKLSESIKSGDKDLKELFASLGIVVKEKSDDGSAKLRDIKSSAAANIKSETATSASQSTLASTAANVETEPVASTINTSDVTFRLNEDSTLSKTNIKDIKDLFASLGIVVKEKSDDGSAKLRDIKSSAAANIKSETATSASQSTLASTAANVETEPVASTINTSDVTFRLNEDSTLSKTNIKDIKDLFASLGIVVKSKSDGDNPNANNAKLFDTASAATSSNTTLKSDETVVYVVPQSGDTDAKTNSTNRTTLKNSSEFFNEISQKKVINNAEIEKEQSSKIMAGMTANAGNNISISAVGRNTIGDASNGNIVSDLIQSINSSETLISGKKNNPQSGSKYNEDEIDPILSKADKKQSINLFDSKQSSDSSFFNQSDNRGTSLGAATNKSASSVLPSYVTNQVVRSINRAISSGENEIRLQLRPAELGRIFMTIETVGDTLNVSIVAENQTAKDILTGHADDLKSSLANNGISIGSFDVEVGSDFKQSMANSGQQSQNGTDSGRNNSSSGQRSSISTGEIEGVQNILNNEDGNLHFVA
ncbi:MAG: flagellar hook-length control protein FliK, partial [Desulfamplus sp.]|nr:flagellar hook-length control protein FliK [Desulfamplus sp.]